MGRSAEEEYSASSPYRAEGLVERLLVAGRDNCEVDSVSRDLPDMNRYVFGEGVDCLVSAELLAELESRLNYVAADYPSLCCVA